MTAEPEAGPASPAHRGPAPPAPTVRAVAHVVLPPAPTVRATAHVDGPVVRAAAPARFRAKGSASVPPALLARAPVAAEALLAPPPGRVPEKTTPEARRAAPEARARAGSGATRSAAEAVDAGTIEAAPARVPKRGSKVRRALLPVSAEAAAAFVAATGYLAVTEPRPDPDVGRWSALGAAATAAAPTGPSWNPLATGSTDPFAAVAPALRGAPTRLRVKAIGVDTSLESLHLGNDGALTPPKDFAKAGWYADGTAPGDQGPAVIAGHVDSRRGPAVFYKLRELEAGDRVDVVRGGKTVRFTVVSTAWYPKNKFPKEQVYGPTPDRQLRLITCGGVFDHRLRSYKDNLVVYAVAG